MHKKMYMLLALLCTSYAPLYGNAWGDFLDGLNKWSEFNKKNREMCFAPKNNVTRSVTKEPGIGLDDLVGSHPEQLDDIVDFFLHQEEREAQGIEMPRGILLCGPAGTGKTSYAKALAHDLGWQYIECSASDFEEMYVGVGASRVRALFAEARNKQPCIIIIDEVDAIGTRESMFGSSLRAQVIDALLAEMDGIHTSGKILVIGTTNLANEVDKALRRPGRFDYVIEISLPDEASRKEIIEYYLHKKKYDATIDVSALARGTAGFSGAELKEIVKRASMAAVRNRHAMIMQDDLQDGFKQLIKEKNSRR